MKKIVGLFLAVTLSLSANLVFAHGEDKSGPNGGFIRMPGAFHTEIVPDGKNQLKVYLLDLQWKNPTIVSSAVSVELKGKTKLKAKCEVQNSYYVCRFPKSVDLTKKGQLAVLAQRENQKGSEALYALPFTLEVIDEGHGGHH